MSDNILARAGKMHGDKIECREKYKAQLEIKTHRDYVLNLLTWLKSERYVHLSFMSCIDWIEENEFELVWHVFSYESKNHILVKTRLNREKPWMHTAINIWPHVQPYEQEIHEMFGVYFPGNPDLSGLFLHNWLDLPPLRKDFIAKDYSLALYTTDALGLTPPFDDIDIVEITAEESRDGE
ncbi:MAG: NADH-quinone oxidoreductase subunit C [Deltaproteobacteria bacterium]|nr:NADH-quinone oxidoreductase subunit C [Deltaproteobacteria bacterium]